MSSMVYGTVQKITEKNVNGRVYFGLVLRENTDQLYRCGTERPTCSVGDRVSFEDNPGKYGVFVKDNTLKVTGAEAPQAPTAPTARSNYENKEKYWADKEVRDIEDKKRYAYRGAWAAAREFVELCLANGALKLGAANAKAPDKWDILKESIDKLAGELYIQFQNECFEIEAYSEKTPSVDGVPSEEANGGDWKE